MTRAAFALLLQTTSSIRLLVLALIGLALPRFAVVLPMYDISRAIGIYDTTFALAIALVAINQPFTIWLLRNFFAEIPRELDEAAKIDGAGHARIFFTIILRLVAPVLAVIGLLSFIGTMNDFLIASVILVDPDKQTLAVGLYQFVSQETARNWSVFAAGAVLAAILPMALFLSLQRFIVGGLTAGSVK